jgi:VanZ family protein
MPVILWAGFIFFLSSYGNPLQSPVVTSIQAEVNSIDIPNVSIRPMLPKIGLSDLAAIVNHSEFTRRIFHLLLYLVLGYLVYRALIAYAGRYAFLVALMSCSLYGLSDEFHQRFVPGRSFQWPDLAFDIFGAFLGILLYHWVVRFLVHRRLTHLKKESNPAS